MKSHHLQKLSIVFAFLFVSVILMSSVHAQNMFRKVNDFDGDGRADYAVTRNENGSKVWYVWQSTAGFRALQWGLASDKNVSGDYDGDGKTDFAVYRVIPRANNGPDTAFYVYRSMTNTIYIKVGSYTQPVLFMEPLPQDYDGDGKTDVTEYFRWDNVSCCKSINVWDTTRQNPNTHTDFLINVNTSALRLGDLTGDGKSDIVSYDPTNYDLTIVNYDTRNSQTIRFGTSGDQYVPGDFDGDGTGDVAIFRESNGTWWWLRSSDGAIHAATWGSPGDKPVPADYDGDGKTDLAIWRDGYYWISGSQNGVSVFNWGLSTDMPVTY